MHNSNFCVYLVEDDLSISRALMALFESVQIEVICYNDPHFFLEAFKRGEVRNGCIILDVRLPNIGGLELQESLTQNNNLLPVIFITAHGDIEMAVRAMKIGAFDFIPKPFNNQQLLAAVQKSFAAIPLCNNVTQFKDNMMKLTPREKEVLGYVINGKMNKEIGYTLNIALSTVEIHRANIMRKLGMKNLAELINYYLLTRQVSNNNLVGSCN
ncbi:sigma 54-dependent response regulator [Legionella birminghamensis]|uniref:Sigma 54-dependent response regulator n=1 Tax=Legionella birminghamensis TaxID=28083 RepID=A0A378IBP9_9GAMM|nr:response regulator [Legionella birminghamensis]KTC74519.1 sigma 54-dependent response regulator [Legionella birminghamensis]STX32648.1 sigma 54-dependent response regulator [Legionella birminghamensis]